MGLDPKLVKDKKKLLIKLQYTFHKKIYLKSKRNLMEKKFFYLEKKVTPDKFKNFFLGEKSIRLEPKITRIYPDKNLFSHILDKLMMITTVFLELRNRSIKKLKNGKKKSPLTLDKELQFIIQK